MSGSSNLDSNKTAGEEARRQLHKNAASNLEQVLAATPHKTPTVRPPHKHKQLKLDDLQYSPMGRETGVQSYVKSYQRFIKMVFDASLLNTQHYKVWIKGKVEQFREKE